MLATRKAQELDVVELTEDLPEYGLKQGERGTVVVAFDEPRRTILNSWMSPVNQGSHIPYGRTRLTMLSQIQRDFELPRSQEAFYHTCDVLEVSTT